MSDLRLSVLPPAGKDGGACGTRGVLPKHHASAFRSVATRRVPDARARGSTARPGTCPRLRGSLFVPDFLRRIRLLKSRTAPPAQSPACQRKKPFRDAARASKT